MTFLRTLTIETESTSAKSRSFSAILLAHVEAFAKPDKTTRPVYLSVACPTASAAPFQANLRLGRRADIGNSTSARDRFEILRSAGYTYTQQRHPEGVIITAYAPGLFEIDPGMVDPSEARFVALPSRQWVEAQTHLDYAGAIQHMRRAVASVVNDEGLAKLFPLATLFATYLDRRTRCPIIPDLDFHLQVLVASLDRGLASMHSDSYYGDNKRGPTYVEHGTDRVGLAPGAAFAASHSVIDEFLAEQVTIYYAARDGRTQRRVA